MVAFEAVKENKIYPDLFILFFPIEEKSWQALDLQEKGRKQYGYHFPLVVSEDPTKHTPRKTLPGD